MIKEMKIFSKTVNLLSFHSSFIQLFLSKGSEILMYVPLKIFADAEPFVDTTPIPSVYERRGEKIECWTV